jgi:hypothetical protein
MKKAVVALGCCSYRYGREVMKLFVEEDLSTWHPSAAHRSGPRVVLMLRSGRPSHCDVVVLDRPGPVARPC